MNWDSLSTSTWTTPVTNASGESNHSRSTAGKEPVVADIGAYQLNPPVDLQEDLYLHAGTDLSAFNLPLGAPPSLQQMTEAMPIKCWLHNCGGRTFSCLSNYRRHCKEKEGMQGKVACPRCPQTFSRKTALKLHMEKGRCKVVKFDANGVPYRQPWWMANFDAELLDFDCTNQSVGLPDPNVNTSQHDEGFHRQ
ncbi:hypothetical protein F4808DRAFT_474834 [Astrocystis sublimbata]|nr:hypothetical protein F4808DRAFT_474834 [Astrocystis sublimbata]